VRYAPARRNVTSPCDAAALHGSPPAPKRRRATVHDQIRDKLADPFADRGEQHVKNIARPVRVYALGAGTVANARVAEIALATSISPPVAAPRLSIVVLPFTNLSYDREQQYFADGEACAGRPQRSARSRDGSTNLDQVRRSVEVRLKGTGTKILISSNRSPQ
jgi:hypothetical protein